MIKIYLWKFLILLEKNIENFISSLNFEYLPENLHVSYLQTHDLSI